MQQNRNQRPVKPEDRGWNRQDIDRRVSELLRHNAKIVPNLKEVGAFEYKIWFFFEGGIIVSLNLFIGERQTDSDVVIIRMTTSPVFKQSKGYGSRVIEYIVAWTKANNWNEVRATQVNNDGAKRFWKKNGFLRMPPPNKTGDYVRVIVR